MRQTVKVRWWYWAQYALWTAYDVVMGMFYMLAFLLSFGVLFSIWYYVRIIL